ncbi:N-ethylammeline chlorohydrolase [Capsulimonas corticalis]|uniref:N-ethylammeline chlorohydrolase n=1 Tax=Capsulimonas corticalis TaxID=2219043 RepID=A0A402CYC0_9BACT|nr:amidohydrolase family protein [Capsulimonas corticalis]BDI31378.1 N-ethylammeline chlorohydrolase [Capsulimonas corticalis]
MSIQTYRAKWILPIDAEPMEDGEVVVEDGRIAAVRARVSGSTADRDFGDAVLAPGFVNAHTHLEYTVQRGFLEDVPFFPWVRALNAAKAHLSPDDWLMSSRLGAMECLAGGITTIGDNTDAGVTMTVASESGLRATIYQEIFGIDDREPIAPILEALRGKIEAHRRFASDRVRAGVSPHALYTLRPELLRALAEYLRVESLPSSIHIAESPAESALMERGEGPFWEMYLRRGITWTPPGVSPTRYADDLGLLNAGTLAIHCVQQDESDIAAVANSGASIVHCPKSNAKLGAGIAPLARWLKTEGLTVGLGTDSAVSNNTLDMFEEMRAALLMQRGVQRDVEAVSARDVMRMATLGGAEAMGWGDVTGSLTPGKRADLAAIRLSRPHTTPATDPYSALVYSARADDVVMTLCDGDALYDEGAWRTIDGTATLSAAREIRARLSDAMKRGA